MNIYTKVHLKNIKIAEFWKFTTIMKRLSMYDLWNDFNQTREKYDFKLNHDIWKNVQPDKAPLHLLLEKEYFLKTISFQTSFQTNFKTKKINRMYLGNDFIQNNINYVIKSDMGTGKTTAVSHFLQEQSKNYISIVSRKSLAMQQCTMFHNCQHYLKIKNHRLLNGNNLVIQVDSLMKIGRNIDLSNYILILDEFESIIDYIFLSTTMKNKRISIFMKFLEIMKKCKNFICIDADITYKSILFINKFIQRQFITYENTYIANKNVNAFEIQSQQTFLQKLASEKSFLLCSDSAKQAKAIYDFLNDTSIILITSDLNDNAETDQYYQFDKHHKIIYSPKVIYGIDSSMERPVYCFYKEHTINPKSMIQQISRCRNITNLYYHFTKKSYIPNNINFEQVLKKNKEIVYYSQSDDSLIETGFYLIDHDIEYKYIELFSYIEYENICYNTNKYAHFLKLLQERGFSIKTDFHTPGKIPKTPKINNKGKELTFQEFINIDKNKKMLQLLQIPLDNQIIMQHFNTIQNYDFLKNYIAFKWVFFKNLNDQQLDEKLQKDTQDQDEFIIGRINNLKQKIRFLIKFKQLTGSGNNRKDLRCTKLLENKDIENIIYEYNIIFDKKYYTAKIDLTTFHSSHLFLAKLYKTIFGKNILKTFRFVDKGHKKRRKAYTFNNDEFNNYKIIFDSSKN